MTVSSDAVVLDLIQRAFMKDINRLWEILYGNIDLGLLVIVTGVLDTSWQ